MKQKWSRFEILVTCLSIATIPIAARLAAVGLTLLETSTSIPALAALFVVPLICTAGLVHFLKKRGKQVRPAVAILTVAVALFGLAGKYLSEFTRLVKLITGHYNAEANGFFLLMMLLMFGGALAGISIGCLIYRMFNRKNST